MRLAAFRTTFRQPSARAPHRTSCLQPTMEGATPRLTISPALLPPGAKGLVFDCDGTLVDSMPQHLKAWQHTCAVHGLTPMTAELMVELAGKPVHELLDVVAEQSGKASHQVDRLAFFDTKGRFYVDNHSPAQVIEATLDIVRAGAAAGLPMAVASGGSRAHVLQGLTETGILHYFQAVVCAEDVTNGKPAPDGFLLAAEKLGVAPEFCVGYEDAKLGMEAITAAGFMAAVDVTVLPNYPHLV
ncbi:HAD-like domain-containing protein [Haematococcus lacustris]